MWIFQNGRVSRIQTIFRSDRITFSYGSSCAGLTRASMLTHGDREHSGTWCRLVSSMDCRVKPGNDAVKKARFNLTEIISSQRAPAA
jgi:hypothetical protein